MNSILFFPEEISGSQAVVRGQRRSYLLEEHVLSPEGSYFAGVLTGNRGRATCTLITDDEVRFEVNFDQPPLSKLNAAFIVAVPRPQTVKKVIQSITSFGASSLHFVKTQHVVPSYLSSKTLHPEAIRSEVFKALEQTRDTIVPEISIHASWRGFVQHTLPHLSQSYATRLIAHTREEGKVPQAVSSLLAAIGPESGWSDPEIEELSSYGFITCSLGQRILRVEHAVVKLLSALG